ncbi:MAG: sugar ABC transporter permease [Pseudomonadota bacterium]
MADIAQAIPTRPAPRASASRETAFAQAILAPAAIIVFVVMILPIFANIYISFQSIPWGGDWSFAGTRNFEILANEPLLYIGLTNTLIWIVVVTTGTIVFSFVTAALLNSDIKGRQFIVFLLLVPWVLPIPVSAVGWTWIYNGDFGILNYVLADVLGIESAYGWAWTGHPDTAFASVMVTEIWRKFPFYTIITLAAMQTVPKTLYEAAEMDGAGPVARFFHVTLPGLKPVFVIVILLNLIWTFQAFPMIYLLTSGGPLNSSQVMGTLIYYLSFGSLKFDLAAAMGTVTIGLLLIVTVIYIQFQKIVARRR